MKNSTALPTTLRALAHGCLLAASTLLLGSCKKDEPAPAPPTVVGTWTGQYSNSATAAPTLTWEPMTLNGDGSVTGSNRQGTYAVTGTVLTATYVRAGTTFSFRGNITDNVTKLTGTWGDGANQTNRGQLLLTKQ